MLVTAAFIGPGTVTTASMAGAQFGYALVWALLFSIIATFTLQEMASRLGIVTGKGLAEALKSRLSNPLLSKLAMLLVIAAIGIGNAAYQAGNLTGAALGLSQLLSAPITVWVLALASVAAVLLWLGKYQLLERTLIVLVGVMSVVFIVTMLIAGPDWPFLLNGIWQIQVPSGAELMVIALVGTTVVPYNLFLHASIVASSQATSSDSHISEKLAANRKDAALSIGLGGLVTLAILSTAASAFFASSMQLSASNIASQLEPLLGNAAGYFFAAGFFAAGLTSAITAPLAAAYAVCGAVGWPATLTDSRFRMVWMVVLLSGALFASLGVKPLIAILFAQATNGLLLPIIAIFLLLVMNSKRILGEHTNGALSNLIGGLIVLLVSGLGVYKILSLV
ncbi:Nramp family divalent metal transporter [Aestuariibacter salexigens]|uniref:Nramp family divalent metal transporter n=1 Tax=Aestuariibacter salexigens TaxID=226010 RepID=UPI000558D184|nr:Nramp family divalent metal transporter [Aestuariibacter salexigens]